MFTLLKVQRGLEKIQKLLDLVKDKNAVICGGYVRYCASTAKSPVKAGDVDIYCETQSVFDELKSHFESAGLSIRHENHVAVTYKQQREEGKKYSSYPTIQLIKPLTEGAIMLRFMKYAKKGYHTKPTQLMKLFSDWDGRTMDYRAKIIDELTLIEEGEHLTQEDIDELEALLRID